VYLHAGPDGRVTLDSTSSTVTPPGQVVDPGHRTRQRSLFDIRPAAASV
jgi:hypothetical protein